MSILDDIIKKIDQSKISNKCVGVWIRAMHFNAPIYLLLMILFGNFNISLMAIILLMLNALLYIILGGCWITKLEKELCGDSVDGVDLLLDIINIKNTENNKDVGTVIVGTIVITFAFFIFFMKYQFKSQKIIDFFNFFLDKSTNINIKNE
jgi:hypothetical protein